MAFELSAIINLQDNFSETAAKCISFMEQMGKQSQQASKHISDIGKSAKSIKKVSSQCKAAEKSIEKLGSGKDNLSPKMKNYMNLMQQMDKQASNTSASVSTIPKSIGKSISGQVKSTKSLGNNVKNFSGKIKNAMVAMSSGAVNFLKGTISSASKTQEIDAELAQTIKSTGGAAGVTAKQVGSMADAFSKTTVFSSDTIKQGQNVLLTFGNIGKDILPKATQSMLDYAQETGGNVVDASNKLGKALSDPINNFSELNDVGVTLSDQQKNQIQTFQKTGQMAKAQGIIIDELNKKVGGQAAAAAQTYDGKMKQLGNTIGNIKTSIGSALLPYVQKAADAFLGIARKIDGLPKPVINAAAAVIALVAVFGTAIKTTGMIKSKFTGILPNFDASKIKRLIGPIGLVIAIIALLAVAYKKNLGGFRTFVDKMVKDVTKLFNKLVTWVKANWPKMQKIIQKAIQGIKLVSNTILVPVIKFIIQGFTKIISWVKKNWPLIQKTITVVMNAIRTIIMSVLNLITAFWKNHGNTIMKVVASMWNIIKTCILTALKVIAGVIQVVMNVICGNWGAAWKGIVNIVKTILSGIGGVIKSAFSIVSAIFKDLASSALNWGKDFVMGIVNGIKGAAHFVADAVQSIAKTISGFLHFSKPDVGPLVDYETWMPDFMKGMSKGMANSKSLIVKATQDVAVGIKGNMKPSPSLIKNVGGSKSTSPANITINMGGVSVRKDSDIDKIATAIVSKLKIASLNMV